jgi:Na+/H+-dicarboxylate symporter
MLRFFGQYLAILLSGLLLYQFVVLGGLAWLSARVRPVKCFGGSWLPILTALATGSSSATLPTTMRTAEDDFGISRKVVQFVLPLSATMSRGGTALFSVITVLFLAQAFGTTVTGPMCIWLAVLATVTALSGAGILRVQSLC